MTSELMGKATVLVQEFLDGIAEKEREQRSSCRPRLGPMTCRLPSCAGRASVAGRPCQGH